MKKIYLLLVLFGAFLLCACEKETIDPLVEDQAQTQVEESALKGAKKGMTQQNLTPWPMVARMGSGAEFVIPATDEYGVIIFYVNDPDVIGNHDFYSKGWFFPGAFGFPEDAFSVEGTSWHLPDYPMAPHHYHAVGKGDVLIWIITIDQVMQLYNDGSITVPKIAACNPLVGYATSYNEVLRPYGGGAHVMGGVITAHGTLINGQKFHYHMHSKMKEGEPLEAKYKLTIFDK